MGERFLKWTFLVVGFSLIPVGIYWMKAPTGAGGWWHRLFGHSEFFLVSAGLCVDGFGRLLGPLLKRPPLRLWIPGILLMQFLTALFACIEYGGATETGVPDRAAVVKVLSMGHPRRVYEDEATEALDIFAKEKKDVNENTFRALGGILIVSVVLGAVSVVLED